MNYEVLARKWRPKQFKDLIGQDHIVKALKGSLSSQNIAHAHLFTGTRGVGKTTLARIFSKALNCDNLGSDAEPCLKCQSCVGIDEGNSLNYQEVDGASHNGVEHIREMIERLQYLPTTGRYRVYVIDEVHMLSQSAFNALLKTLEEPPAHVIFIFATTDPQKLLDTIISRCQRYDLRSINLMSLKDYIAYIGRTEGIQFENDKVLDLVCKLGKGSVRDTLTALEQIKNFSGTETVTEEVLFYQLGLAKTEALEKIVTGILTGDVPLVSKTYQSCLHENIDIKTLFYQLSEHLFEIVSESITNNNGPIPSKELLWIYETLQKDFDWTLKSVSPEQVFAVVLQKLAGRRAIYKGPAAKQTAPVETSKPVSKQPAPHKMEMPINSHKAFDLKNFIKYLANTRPASAANLEFGNIISLKEADSFELKIGFPQKSEVSFDYFSEKDVFASVHKELCKFVNKTSKDVKLLFEVLEEAVIKEKNFQSVSEIEQRHDQNREKELKNEFESENILKEAEKIFGGTLVDVKVNRPGELI